MSSSNYELKNIQETSDNDNDKSPDVLIVGGRQQHQTNNTEIKPHHHLGDPNDEVTRSVPTDKYRMVFFIFLIHGIGTLMPWNMFCTADGYFRDYKLKPSENDTNDVKIELESMRKHFYFYLGIASQIPNLLFSGLNLLVDIGSGNLKIRVNASLLIELAIFIATIILASIDSTGWPITFFYITMASVVLLNMVAGVYQNCIFGTSAKFPPNYTNAVLIGSNLSGTFTSVVLILSIWIAPGRSTAAIFYFTTAVITILVCLISYNVLPWIRFYRYFEHRQDESPLQTSDYIIVESGPTLFKNPSDDVPDNLRETVDAMVPKPPSDLTFKERLSVKLKVLVKCGMQLFNVWLIFFVTLALFPSTLADIKPAQEFIDKDYFGPVFCFLVFNASALFGNVISYFTSWPGKDRVWLLTVARLLFIPFFLLCNFKPDASKARSWPILLPYDLAFAIGNLIMGLSSGYLSSICMMFVSSGLNPNESIIAGMLGGFFLIFGIFCGVMSNSLLTGIVYWP